jgi:hypothetical protein
MEELNNALIKQYPTENLKEKKFVIPKDPEPVLKQLLFILNHLLERGKTLSVICPSDFGLRDKVLFLKKETHIVDLEDGHFYFKGSEKCFLPEGVKEGKHSLTVTYDSVALFAFYLWTRKKKTSLTDSDFGKLKGTKLYYFIRNAMERNPILLYL